MKKHIANLDSIVNFSSAGFNFFLHLRSKMMVMPPGLDRWLQNCISTLTFFSALLIPVILKSYSEFLTVVDTLALRTRTLVVGSNV